MHTGHVVTTLFAAVVLGGCSTPPSSMSGLEPTDKQLPRRSLEVTYADIVAATEQMAQSLAKVNVLKESATTKYISFAKMENCTGEEIDVENILSRIRTELSQRNVPNVRFVDYDADSLTRVMNYNNMIRAGTIKGTPKEVQAPDYILRTKLTCHARANEYNTSRAVRMSFVLDDMAGIVVWTDHYEQQRAR